MTTKRYVLYSPGYGAGWTSWHSGPREQKKFMLEYKPLVDYLLQVKGDREVHLAKMEELQKQFLADWEERFPGVEPPYMGGWKQMSVYAADPGVLVYVKEYDGYESIETADGMEWL